MRVLTDQNMLDDRTRTLLAGLIQQYIRTARPVSSMQLLRLLGLKVSPATVRAALHDLEEAGFIYQPHTSAGRIPTDRGYRYYVDNVRDKQLTKNEHESIEERFRVLQLEYQQLGRSVAKLLALLSHSVVLTGIPEDKEFQLEGLREVLKQPEAESHDTVQEVSEVVEALDSYLGLFAQRTHHGPEVLIGEEIPFIHARHTSVLIQGAHPEESQQMLLVIIGPKRMPYQRNVQLLNAVSDIIERQRYE